MSSKSKAGSRAEQKQETRRTLLAAAQRCFAEKGFGGTVVADVVRAAGVAHGTFYVHFDSREAIADALLAEVNATLATRLAPVLARAPKVSRAVTLRAVARTFLDLLDEDRAFVRGYAERAAQGLQTAAFTEGVNPPILAALAPVLGAEAGGAPGGRLSLALHGLLALWLRVSLRYVLVPGVTRADAESVLVTLTTGALDALLPMKATPSRGGPRKKGLHGTV